MIHAVLIDDEYNGLKSLELLIEKFVADVKVVASTIDPLKGVELINNYRPDIVFLDINMPNLNGFELLKKLEFSAFHLIFTTAHREYALKAIKESATDYLLKPIDATDLNLAVEKVKQKISEKQKQPDALDILKHIYEIQDTRVSLPTKTAIEYVSPNDIVYIEAFSNYAVVFLRNGKEFTVYKALKDYEQQLCKNELAFIRIHNSYIINVNYVTRYLKDDGGYAVIQSRKSIPISKNKKEAFLKLINFRH
ncbi:MAG: LytTR family DNA-binding domain-containing protein [Bacteroidota bacterium]